MRLSLIADGSNESARGTWAQQQIKKRGLEPGELARRGPGVVCVSNWCVCVCVCVCVWVWGWRARAGELRGVPRSESLFGLRASVSSSNGARSKRRHSGCVKAKAFVLVKPMRREAEDQKWRARGERGVRTGWRLRRW
jgi:hypothetical protein